MPVPFLEAAEEEIMAEVVTIARAAEISPAKPPTTAGKNTGVDTPIALHASDNTADAPNPARKRDTCAQPQEIATEETNPSVAKAAQDSKRKTTPSETAAGPAPTTATSKTANQNNKKSAAAAVGNSVRKKETRKVLFPGCRLSHQNVMTKKDKSRKRSKKIPTPTKN